MTHKKSIREFSVFKLKKDCIIPHIAASFAYPLFVNILLQIRKHWKRYLQDFYSYTVICAGLWNYLCSPCICRITSHLCVMHYKMKWVMIYIKVILFQGFSFPAVHVMISKWSPFEERSLISSVIYAGENRNVSSLILWPHIFVIEFMVTGRH
jgi:hypothetical protein